MFANMNKKSKETFELFQKRSSLFMNEGFEKSSQVLIVIIQMPCACDIVNLSHTD